MKNPLPRSPQARECVNASVMAYPPHLPRFRPASLPPVRPTAPLAPEEGVEEKGIGGGDGNDCDRRVRRGGGDGRPGVRVRGTC